MNEDIERETTANETNNDGTPVGAIVITSILAVTIVVLWFGIYILNIARS